MQLVVEARSFLDIRKEVFDLVGGKTLGDWLQIARILKGLEKLWNNVGAIGRSAGAGFFKQTR